ncbi:MAG: hypothetical protein WC596_03205 [Candidatus Shapirobacteria bacterium]
MNKKFILFIIFALGLIGSYRLFRPGYFSMQDDMHVFRLQQLDICVHDGQIPCRYVPDGGFGYGYPLFNFYSPLPYAIGEIFHFAGFPYIDSIKLVFILTSFIRPVGIFLLSSLFFGPGGGLVSAILFSLAPYQAINSYVRGALAENLGLALLPFVFYFSIKKKYLLYALFLAFLALSHNLTLLYVAPLLILTHLIFFRSKIISFIKYSFLGFLLSVFFVLPAFFEKQFTTVATMTQGYFYYIIHFVTLKQLFINHNDWGFGASLWGPIDDMSFQLGYLQWFIPLIIIFYLILNYKTKIKNKYLIITFFFVGLFSLFLTHNKSTFIWQHISLLPFYQFPWRFLAPAVFSFALISGFLLQIKFFKKYRYLTVLSLLFLVLLLNFSFFKEDIWFPYLTDQQKLSPANVIAQSDAGLKDYWPVFSKNFPNYFAKGPEVIAGTAQIVSFSKNSHSATGKIIVSSDNAFINLPVVYFPNFSLKVDNIPSPYVVDHDLGLITLNLSSGTHSFYLSFENTPLRFIANTISTVSFIIFILLSIFREKKH